MLISILDWKWGVCSKIKAHYDYKLCLLIHFTVYNDLYWAGTIKLLIKPIVSVHCRSMGHGNTARGEILQLRVISQQTTCCISRSNSNCQIIYDFLRSKKHLNWLYITEKCYRSLVGQRYTHHEAVAVCWWSISRRFCPKISANFHSELGQQKQEEEMRGVRSRG